MLPIAALVLTITLDNGRECAMHELLSSMLNAPVFFAKPYHSWERGLNENTNRLIRQYYPKKTSFDSISESHLLGIESVLTIGHHWKCLASYVRDGEVHFVFELAQNEPGQIREDAKEKFFRLLAQSCPVEGGDDPSK